jgi:hypothetical protein
MGSRSEKPRSLWTDYKNQAPLAEEIANVVSAIPRFAAPAKKDPIRHSIEGISGKGRCE